MSGWGPRVRDREIGDKQGLGTRSAQGRARLGPRRTWGWAENEDTRGSGTCWAWGHAKPGTRCTREHAGPGDTLGPGTMVSGIGRAWATQDLGIRRE